MLHLYNATTLFTIAVKLDPEPVTMTGTETDTDSDMDTGTASVTDSDMDTEADSDMDTEADSDMDTEAKSITITLQNNRISSCDLQKDFLAVNSKIVLNSFSFCTHKPY
jgi:hypothetical protein